MKTKDKIFVAVSRTKKLKKSTEPRAAMFFIVF
jgi:hypothetical protein